MYTILVLEDDFELNQTVSDSLKKNGYRVLSAYTCKEGQKLAKTYTFNMAILDVNLPDGSGYEYLRWVRERTQIPVLILTANDMEMDEVMGLTLGADDYMTKPFSLAVLRARIKALIRRGNNVTPDVFEDGEFYFDFGRLLFTRNGQEISLSVNEQRLLRLLLENRGRVLTRSVLVDRLWSGGGEYVDENALSVTIRRLRGKLEDVPGKPRYIKTVYGIGYVWAAGCAD